MKNITNTISTNPSRTDPHLASIQRSIIACEKCYRLRSWCTTVATEKRKSYANEIYWGKPVPGFGDSGAQVLIVGLAPAAHGANRTGRMFTGDNSGLWLYRALHKHGFANQASSLHAQDGLKLFNAYITSIVHCAPPDNKPNPEETNQCVDYLHQELAQLRNIRVILALGSFAWNGLFKVLGKGGKRPTFSHGAQTTMGDYLVIGSYHPSQQNTFTKKLTEPMFDKVFIQIKKLLK